MCIAGGQIQDFTRRTGESERLDDTRRQTRTLGPHQHLYFEGDARTHVFVVVSGWVKLYRTLIDGQRQVVAFANAGSILGLESDVDYANACETMTPVVVESIPASRIHEICLQDGAFAETLLRQLGRQLGAAQSQLAAVGAQSAEQKLATFLLAFARLSGALDGQEFDLPMRRGDMGEFLGLRLETVSRKVSEFQRRGWIRMTSLYRCRLLKPAILQELAEGGGATEGAMLRAG
jgi:CRP-like cAMP-binding protein